MLILPAAPADEKDVLSYLQVLHIMLEDLVRPDLQYLTLEEMHVEPGNRIDNMICLVDGTNWNPGSGKGVYRYQSSTATWIFLG